MRQEATEWEAAEPYGSYIHELGESDSLRDVLACLMPQVEYGTDLESEMDMRVYTVVVILPPVRAPVGRAITRYGSNLTIPE
jgi:hypothetical protein